nr:immunoglobulin heavy chain junction region [Mus musculus]
CARLVPYSRYFDYW